MHSSITALAVVPTQLGHTYSLFEYKCIITNIALKKHLQIVAISVIEKHTCFVCFKMDI